MADQLVSSATNFVVAALIARELTSAELGQFGMLFAVYLLTLSVSRSWTSEPLFVRLAGTSFDSRHSAIRSTIGLALGAGVLGGVALLTGMMLLADSASLPSVMMALTLPAVLLQDVLRMGLIAVGRPGAATTNDALWWS